MVQVERVKLMVFYVNYIYYLWSIRFMVDYAVLSSLLCFCEISFSLPALDFYILTLVAV